jgi:hypothetical protein
MKNYTQVNEMVFESKSGDDIKRHNLESQFFWSSGLEYQQNFDLDKDYLLPLTSNGLHRNPNLMPNNLVH